MLGKEVHLIMACGRRTSQQGISFQTVFNVHPNSGNR